MRRYSSYTIYIANNYKLVLANMKNKLVVQANTYSYYGDYTQRFTFRSSMNSYSKTVPCYYMRNYRNSKYLWGTPKGSQLIARALYYSESHDNRWQWCFDGYRLYNKGTGMTAAAANNRLKYNQPVISTTWTDSLAQRFRRYSYYITTPLPRQYVWAFTKLKNDKIVLQTRTGVYDKYWAFSGRPSVSKPSCYYIQSVVNGYYLQGNGKGQQNTFIRIDKKNYYSLRYKKNLRWCFDKNKYYNLETGLNLTPSGFKLTSNNPVVSWNWNNRNTQKFARNRQTIYLNNDKNVLLANLHNKLVVQRKTIRYYGDLTQRFVIRSSISYTPTTQCYYMRNWQNSKYLWGEGRGTQLRVRTLYYRNSKNKRFRWCVTGFRIYNMGTGLTITANGNRLSQGTIISSNSWNDRRNQRFKLYSTLIATSRYYRYVLFRQNNDRMVLRPRTYNNNARWSWSKSVSVSKPSCYYIQSQENGFYLRGNGRGKQPTFHRIDAKNYNSLRYNKSFKWCFDKSNYYNQKTGLSLTPSGFSNRKGTAMVSWDWKNRMTQHMKRYSSYTIYISNNRKYTLENHRDKLIVSRLTIRYYGDMSQRFTVRSGISYTPRMYCYYIRNWMASKSYLWGNGNKEQLTVRELYWSNRNNNRWRWCRSGYRFYNKGTGLTLTASNGLRTNSRVTSTGWVDNWNQRFKYTGNWVATALYSRYILFRMNNGRVVLMPKNYNNNGRWSWSSSPSISKPSCYFLYSQVNGYYLQSNGRGQQSSFIRITKNNYYNRRYDDKLRWCFDRTKLYNKATGLSVTPKAYSTSMNNPVISWTWHYRHTQQYRRYSSTIYMSNSKNLVLANLRNRLVVQRKYKTYGDLAQRFTLKSSVSYSPTIYCYYLRNYKNSKYLWGEGNSKQLTVRNLIYGNYRKNNWKWCSSGYRIFNKATGLTLSAQGGIRINAPAVSTSWNDNKNQRFKFYSYWITTERHMSYALWRLNNDKVILRPRVGDYNQYWYKSTSVSVSKPSCYFIQSQANGYYMQGNGRGKQPTFIRIDATNVNALKYNKNLKWCLDKTKYFNEKTGESLTPSGWKFSQNNPVVEWSWQNRPIQSMRRYSSYTIYLANDQTKVLANLRNKLVEQRRTVRYYGDMTQRFTFRSSVSYTPKEYCYYFRNWKNSKYMWGGNKGEQLRVRTLYYSQINNQRWRWCKNGLRIYNKGTGLTLTANGKITAYTKITSTGWSDSRGQRFNLYNSLIRTSRYSKFVLFRTPSDRLILYPSTYNNNARWSYTAKPSISKPPCYYIQAQSNGFYLQGNGRGKQPTFVRISRKNYYAMRYRKNLRWCLDRQRLFNLETGLSLTPKGYSTTNNTPMVTWDWKDRGVQHYKRYYTTWYMNNNKKLIFAIKKNRLVVQKRVFSVYYGSYSQRFNWRSSISYTPKLYCYYYKNWQYKGYLYGGNNGQVTMKKIFYRNKQDKRFRWCREGYRFYNMATGKTLTASGSNFRVNAPIITTGWSDSRQQRFNYYSYTLQTNRRRRFALYVQPSYKVVLRPTVYNNYARWSQSTSVSISKPSCYYIQSVSDGYYLKDNGRGQQVGMVAITSQNYYSWRYRKEVKWCFDQGLIYSQATGNTLTPSSFSTNEGTPVVTWSSTGSPLQEWNRYYNIIRINTKRNLVLANSDRQLVLQRKRGGYNGSVKQRWYVRSGISYTPRR